MVRRFTLRNPFRKRLVYRSILKYDKLLSSFAFNCNLRPYIKIFPSTPPNSFTTAFPSDSKKSMGLDPQGAARKSTGAPIADKVLFVLGGGARGPRGGGPTRSIPFAAQPDCLLMVYWCTGVPVLTRRVLLISLTT